MNKFFSTIKTIFHWFLSRDKLWGKKQFIVGIICRQEEISLIISFSKKKICSQNQAHSSSNHNFSIFGHHSINHTLLQQDHNIKKLGKFKFTSWRMLLGTWWKFRLTYKIRKLRTVHKRNICYQWVDSSKMGTLLCTNLSPSCH